MINSYLLVKCKHCATVSVPGSRLKNLSTSNSNGGQLRCCQLLWLLILLSISFTAIAESLTTREEKLVAAIRLVRDLIDADARPNESFLQRKPVFPAPPDQPQNDCAFRPFVRAIEQRGLPWFESGAESVVVVPVVAELILVETSNDGGTEVKPGVDGYSWCSFEYERYDFKAARFLAVPNFRNHNHSVEFKSWGQYREIWRSTPMPKGVEPWRFVLIDPDKRYVRFTVRVAFNADRPYRLWPQIPKHTYASDAIHKLRTIAQQMEVRLKILETSDSVENKSQASEATQKLRHQFEENNWLVNAMTLQLGKLSSQKSFSDIRN